MKYNHIDPSVLLGKTLDEVSYGLERGELFFKTSCGDTFKMCSYKLHSVIGNFEDLLGVPILIVDKKYYGPVFMLDNVKDAFTSYEFTTMKGRVILRWITAVFNRSIDPTDVLFMQVNEHELPKNVLKEKPILDNIAKLNIAIQALEKLHSDHSQLSHPCIACVAILEIGQIGDK